MKADASSDAIVRPLITEKTLALAERGNAYTFEVKRSSNKIQIRKSIEDMFGVTVTSVRTQNYMGKFRRVGRYTGATQSWKKAIIQLKDGDAIEFY